MSRYFLEVAYSGKSYSGFQSQENANTIQAEVEKAFQVLQREKVSFTGSSRTDTGVHALQNFFHFDFHGDLHPHFIYKLNAILPFDIVAKAFYPVADNAHCRFDARSREYNYYIYHDKNPFHADRCFFYPYQLDRSLLDEAAGIFKEYTDFTAFSKKRTQVKTFTCHIMQSEWKAENDLLVYQVKADRFLRGMVKGMVGTMLLVGRRKLTLEQLRSVILKKDPAQVNFAVAAHGLFLKRVNFPFLPVHAT